MFKKITYVFLFFLMCQAHAAEDDVLLWFFENPDIVELDGSIVKAGDLVGRGEAAGKSVNAVRISVTDSSGNKVYLKLGDSVGGWTESWNLPDPVLQDWFAGPSFASLAGLNLTDTAQVFAMEIGHAVLDERDGHVLNWLIMASGSETLSNLQSGGYILPEELAYQGDYNWQASMSVPEPSSGLLVLIGGALLALRRKRKDCAA